MTETITASFTTHAPQAIKPNVPLWLTGHQCPRIQYNPTSQYKLKKGENTGWGVVCQYTSRSQKEMNAIYVGGLEERHASGFGEWHSEEERLSYEGGWKDDQASGWGKYCDSWTENWPDGFVKFLSGDCEVTTKFTYEGGFKDGWFHGYGELRFHDGSKYEGTWREGRRVGYGKYIRKNGDLVEFQIEGAIKIKVEEEKIKEKPKPEEPKLQPQPQPQPQVIYVQSQPQPQPQPQLLQPVVLQSPPSIQVTPQGQHEHNANARISVDWGHGHANTAPQQGQTVYYPVDIPHRTSTPQPSPPYAYTRPYTPQPEIPSQPAYMWRAPSHTSSGLPGSPPYPDLTPTQTQYFPHM
jgi:hypothetical protein